MSLLHFGGKQVIINVTKNDYKMLPIGIRSALHQAGLPEGRSLGAKKVEVEQVPSPHLVLLPACIVAEVQGLCWKGDIDLRVDSARLTKVARELDITLYVVDEQFWNEQMVSRYPAFAWASWWTRIKPNDADTFLPLEDYLSRGTAPLTDWERREYGFELVEGYPPVDNFLDRDGDIQSGFPSKPLFYQKSGLFDLVWFDTFHCVFAEAYREAVRRWGQFEILAQPGKDVLIVVVNGQLKALLGGPAVMNVESQMAARAKVLKTSNQSANPMSPN